MKSLKRAAAGAHDRIGASCVSAEQPNTNILDPVVAVCPRQAAYMHVMTRRAAAYGAVVCLFEFVLMRHVWLQHFA